MNCSEMMSHGSQTLSNLGIIALLVIRDSRWTPTLTVTVRCADGSILTSDVPSCSSTG